MTRFGPTIWDELIAAGLGGEPITIEDDNILLGSSFLNSKRSALATVLANHDPTKLKPDAIGPVESAIRALIDEGVIPANRVTALLNRVRGR